LVTIGTKKFVGKSDQQATTSESKVKGLLGSHGYAVIGYWNGKSGVGRWDGQEHKTPPLKIPNDTLRRYRQNTSGIYRYFKNEESCFYWREHFSPGQE
jgi:hypothetical protein